MAALGQQIAPILLAVPIRLQLPLEVPEIAAWRAQSELLGSEAGSEPDQRFHSEQQVHRFRPFEGADARTAVQRAGENSQGVEAAECLTHRPPAHPQSVREVRLDEALSRHEASGKYARSDVLDDLVG